MVLDVLFVSVGEALCNPLRDGRCTWEQRSNIYSQDEVRSTS